MGGYLQKKRSAVAGTPNGDGGAPRRQSETSETLVQFRQAMDATVAVQHQAALQRALDQALARDEAAPHETQPAKPALQRKGIAINDDAGLEREADVMGARAQHDGSTGAHTLTRVAQAMRAASPTAAIQRVNGDTKVKKGPQPQVGFNQAVVDTHKLTLNKYANVSKRTLKEETKTDESGLRKLIGALEQSIFDRKVVLAQYTKLGHNDPKHKDHAAWKSHEHWINNEEAVLTEARDALKKLKPAKTAAAPPQTGATGAKDSKDSKAAKTSNPFDALGDADADADDGN